MGEAVGTLVVVEVGLAGEGSESGSGLSAQLHVGDLAGFAGVGVAHEDHAIGVDELDGGRRLVASPAVQSAELNGDLLVVGDGVGTLAAHCEGSRGGGVTHAEHVSDFCGGFHNASVEGSRRLLEVGTEGQRAYLCPSPSCSGCSHDECKDFLFHVFDFFEG